MMQYVVTLRVSVIVFQSCDVMAAASVSRPGGAQTTEKSQLILKGNCFFFPLARSLTKLTKCESFPKVLWKH